VAGGALRAGDVSLCGTVIETSPKEAPMDQDQFDRIARLLYRISDSQERDEVTREIAKVLASSESSFDTKRFYELANVAYLEDRS
jgi:hypothetical protein